MNKLLLGLPGLYQNWIRKVIDPTAKSETVGTNFRTELQDPTIRWDGKFSLLRDNPYYFEQHQDTFIINTLVNPENFPWYLYNFYGKTDEVFINLDDMVTDFLTKTKNTEAFGDFYKTVSTTYNINELSTEGDIENALVEAIYLNLRNSNNPFRNIVALKCPNANSVNIEYDDFSSSKKIQSLLKEIPDITLAGFAENYALLKSLNDGYFNNKKTMLAKLAKETSLDKFSVLEQAIIGYAISSIKDVKLDWYDKNNRRDLFAENGSGLADFLS